MNRAYYASSISLFLIDDPFRILGILVDSGIDVDEPQKSAWKAQIEILKDALVDIQGDIYFEFSIPRMGKRVDVIILSQGILFVLEFKVGGSHYTRYALDQVVDYALDLKNFHETSHKLPIIPILVATQAPPHSWELSPDLDDVFAPLKANAKNLHDCICYCHNNITQESIDPEKWQSGQYRPTPTIIEAAQALYRGHNVREISRSDAGAKNLSDTSDCIDRIINTTKRNHEKAICFITGVPGSGKTLAGLNIANRRLSMGEREHAVFLSGNGPLVIVLREALIRGEKEKKPKRKDVTRQVEAFIQNIHHFRDAYLLPASVPPDRVVVFDEAQRAWTRDQTSKFMRKKRGQPDFDMSEPEFLIGVMDRQTDWAVIICLIGGGQEINTGEAGLTEWFLALQKRYPKWNVYYPPQITESEYLMGRQPNEFLQTNSLYLEKHLHLSVSVRSYRSENVSSLVKSILDADLQSAKSLFNQVYLDYPIYLTRDISKAKDWLRHKARGSERFGFVASSGGLRLRPEGVFVKDKIEVSHWFLDNRDDVRSSYALEGVATEFDIQGLELDWVGIAWDADLSFFHGEWLCRTFKGSAWQFIKTNTQKRYLKNAYRVLLTRARQGMVIFIPYGDDADATRDPKYYNGTYTFLKNVGIPEIK